MAESIAPEHRPLIAAAPDLLAAAEALVPIVMGYDGAYFDGAPTQPEPALQALIAAIDKAYGRA